MGEELHGIVSKVEVQEHLDRIDKDRFEMYLDNCGGKKLSRKLVEVFTVQIFNLTKTDLEIYGTVEIVGGGKYCTRYIFYRKKEESVLVKGNGSAYLLLNGPKSVFGLEYLLLSFVAHLRDKRDDRLVHMGSCEPFPRGQGVTTVQMFLQPYPSWGRKMERERMRLVFTSVVYDRAVAAYLKVFLISKGNGARPVHGYITAASDAFPDESYLFLKTKSESQSVARGCQIELSKSVVAVPSNGVLKVKVFLPEIVVGVLEFNAKRRGAEEKKLYWQVKVHVEWHLRCDNYIEAVQEKQVTVPESLRI